MLRGITLAAVGAFCTCTALFAAPASPAIGTISSAMPVTINGSEMLPAAAPSWPLADKDEIVTAGPALLQTVNRDTLTLDENTKARVSTTGKGAEYLYVREGGLHFDASQGPVFLCMAGRLYVPKTSAKGALRLNPGSAVSASLEQGSFTEQGARSCGPDFSDAFLSGLPSAAGGTVGGAGGGLRTVGAIAAGTAVALGTTAAAAAGLFGSNAPTACSSASGCNFNPPPISPSTP